MNATTLEEIGRCLYGARWKADLSADLGLSARTLRLYAAKSLAVPDAVIEKARGLARSRAEALLALAGHAVPIASLGSEFRSVAVPLDAEEYVALAKSIGRQRLVGIAASTWEARNATERKVRSRETGVELMLKRVGTYRLQLWGEAGRLEEFDIRTEKGRMAMRELTLAS